MRTFLLFAVVGLAVGCGDAEISCGSPADASGTWSYMGDQSGPTATLTGTVTLSRTGTCTLAGSASLTVDQGSGTPPTYSGRPVGGVFVDENTLEITIDADGRRIHTGDWVGDTVAGDWYDDAGSGSSGSFKMIRTSGAP